MVLTARPGSPRILLRDLWASRQLIATLARKDFFVRYRRASFGLGWAVVLPLLQAAILAAVFSQVVRLRVGLSYAAYVYSGLVAWTYFSATLGSASTSIADSSGMASRIYFPRAVLPLITVVTNLYGLAISMVIMLVVLLVFQVPITLHLLLLVPAVALLLALTLSLALVTSALHVYFRDVRFVVQAVLLALFYLTPVIYPLTLPHGTLAVVVHLNPMTGVVSMFQAAATLTGAPWGPAALVTCAWVAVASGLAALLHLRFDRVFSDRL